MCPNKTKFNPNWLTRADKNEDPISLYIQAIFEDRHRVKCTWCSSDFEIGSRGFLSIKTHSEQKKHVSTANIGQGRNNQKGVLTGHDKNNDLPAGEADQAGQGNDDPRLREGGEGGRGGETDYVNSVPRDRVDIIVDIIPESWSSFCRERIQLQ